MIKERRNLLRIPLVVSVTFLVNQQERTEEYKVKSVNISEGGIFLQTGIPLGLGTEVNLEFSLPGVEESLRCKGKVVWSKSSRNRGDAISGKGIEFTEFGDQYRKLLKKYIEEGARSEGYG